jgi:thiamine kinase-like enzyme
MRIASKHLSVPVPEVIYTRFNDGYSEIGMTIIPGSSLDKHRELLADKTKKSLCQQTWDLIAKLRQIPQKPELQHLFQCAADGSPTLDPLIEDLQQPPRPLETDLQLRSRIYERYIHFAGRRYKDELFDMLPHSSSSVFTHGDIAPRNIMVDDKFRITGLVDWEYSRWYPDYWEYAQIMRPAQTCQTGDWQQWVDATAPQKWDLSGINAARRVMF